MINHADASPIVREYIMYISTVKGKSKNTTDKYFRELRLFFIYLKKHLYKTVDSELPDSEVDISDIDADFLKRITLQDAYEYMYYCKETLKNNEKTRARKTSILKSFFKHITVHEGILKVNPLDDFESPKTKKSLPKYLSLEQCKKLLNSVDGEYKERNYAIITIFLNCGVRLSELCSLNLNDINYDDKVFKITGKGNKERMVYLNDACIYALKAYLRVRPNNIAKDRDALFISRNGNRISARMVEKMIENQLKKSGLDGMGFSTHKLRHTAATLMYQHGGVDIRVLQEILGHENLGTTEIYTHISNDQIRSATDSNPLADIKR